MRVSKNVQIPMRLFDDIFEFISYLEFSSYKFPYMFDLHEMYLRLYEKQHSINLRNSYANIIYAKDEKKRLTARDIYVNLKEK
jgi:hypothetical protein